jgi:5-methyltetrahydrofolate--homocysteine methyltransferase
MSLEELLRGSAVVLLDGACGTQLAARGLDQGGEQNLDHPDAVRSIHEAYVRAGSRVITTNTLTMNRLFLDSHGRGGDVAAVNSAGVELARAAAPGLPVLGDLSSTGKLLEPYGDASEADLEECFREQAAILAEAGVDAFIIETMIDLREALCALRGCRRAALLPVLVTLSFSTVKDGGRTPMGNSVQDSAAALSREGADAIGANCGMLDPFEVAELISRFRESTALPLIAQPNAGRPRLENGSAVFDLGPEEFARGLLECARRGARLVGGCCGTSPAHITEAARLLSAEGLLEGGSRLR